MQLEHSFSVPVGIDEAWPILIDIERIGPCLPGAVIASVDGDEFTGTVKVKLGPINLTYQGTAAFVEKDATARRAVVEARGEDARGNGTAAAHVTATLHEDGAATRVRVVTELELTGKPAQFERGVMVEVGNKLLGQFAQALTASLNGSEAAAPAGRAAAKKAAPAKRTAAKSPAAKAAPRKAPAKAAPAKAAPAKRTRTTAAAKKAAAEAPAEMAAEVAVEVPAEGAVEVAVEVPAEVPAAASPDAVAAVAPDAAQETTIETAADDTDTEDTDTEDLAEETAAAAAPPAGHQSDGELEPIGLLGPARPAVAKRLAPVAVAAVVVLLAVRRYRRPD